jgi:hypothetical protein
MSLRRLTPRLAARVSRSPIPRFCFLLPELLRAGRVPKNDHRNLRIWESSTGMNSLLQRRERQPGINEELLREFHDLRSALIAK